MRRSVLVIAFVCAMLPVLSKADVPRHNSASSRAHNATLRSTHSSGHARKASTRPKTAKSATPAKKQVSSNKSSVCRKGHPCASSRHAALALQQPEVKTTLPTKRLQHVKFALPPPMKGSHESLVRQNVRTDQDGLSRIEDDDDIADMLRSRQLVALPTSSGLRVDPRLASNRRYCRSWTATFLSDLSRAHYARFKAPLQVNSAVRTVEFQRHLQGINGNAAPAEGDIASPHLTGATIDIGKKGLTISQIGWMRAYLLPLQAKGRIDVEEEFQQACFHVTVYKSYSPHSLPAADPLPATAHASEAIVATHIR
jgi:Family of unknown function (DUF5715)